MCLVACSLQKCTRPRRPPIYPPVDPPYYPPLPPHYPYYPNHTHHTTIFGETTDFRQYPHVTKLSPMVSPSTVPPIALASPMGERVHRSSREEHSAASVCVRLMVSTPLGRMEIRASDAGLTHALFVDESPVNANQPVHGLRGTMAGGASGADGAAKQEARAGEHTALAHRHAARAGEELAAYFSGSGHEFTVPIAPAGTPFQQRVWAALLEIAHGQTASYGELARRLGDPGASRAVGLANARNPLAIFVPCHRVLNAAGGLHGYAGGVWRKSFLLELERGRASGTLFAAR
jgi:methylated-DNA-[protein]-cysteine S-methyltransferase